jgi:hypothetical protein
MTKIGLLAAIAGIVLPVASHARATPNACTLLPSFDPLPRTTEAPTACGYGLPDTVTTAFLNLKTSTIRDARKDWAFVCKDPSGYPVIHVLRLRGAAQACGTEGLVPSSIAGGVKRLTQVTFRRGRTVATLVIADSIDGPGAHLTEAATVAQQILDRWR